MCGVGAGGEKNGTGDERGGEVVGFLVIERGGDAGDGEFVDGVGVGVGGGRGGGGVAVVVEVGGAVLGGGGDVGVVVREEVGEGDAWGGRRMVLVSVLGGRWGGGGCCLVHTVFVGSGCI